MPAGVEIANEKITLESVGVKYSWSERKGSNTRYCTTVSGNPPWTPVFDVETDAQTKKGNAELSHLPTTLKMRGEGSACKVVR